MIAEEKTSLWAAAYDSCTTEVFRKSGMVPLCRPIANPTIFVMGDEMFDLSTWRTSSNPGYPDNLWE